MTHEKRSGRDSGPGKNGEPHSSLFETGRPRLYSDIKVGGIDLDLVSSALHKAIRRAEVDTAAYWARHLVVHGFGAYLIRKLAVVAAEDVGLGDPQAVIMADALIDLGVRATGRPNPKGEDLRRVELHLVGAAIVLARAQHSRMLAELTCLVAHRSKHGPRPEFGVEVRDVHTKAGRAAGLKRGSREALRYWQEHSRVVANEVVLDDDRCKQALDALWEHDPSIGFVSVDPDDTEGG